MSVDSAAEAVDSGRRTPVRPVLAVVVVVVVVVVWTVCLPRMVPSLRLDHGIFVSVAERLLAGDRLYSGVWDNKDPLFYYAIALGRAMAPVGDVVVEAVWVAVACVGVLMLVRSVGGAASAATVAGLIVAPLVVTGGLYVAGHSHLPGVAVAVLLCAATARRRYGLAGALLGVLVFLKLLIAPVAVLPLATWVILRRDGRRLPLLVATFVMAVAAVVGLLALRGELDAYLTTQVQNIAYSQTGLLDPHLLPPVGHLARVMTSDALVATLSISAILVVTARWAIRSGDVGCRALWMSALTTLGGAVLVLAATGLWQQHNQILLLPALLSAALLCRRLLPVPRSWSRSRRIAIAAGLVAAAILTGGPEPVGYVRSLVGAPSALAALASTPPETRALLRSGPPATYARVGQNDDRGHAFGLEQWQLVCPHFHQYPFDPVAQLEQDAACLPSADVIVVASSARRLPGRAAWNEYLDRVTATLASGYVCTESQLAKVCRRAD